VLTARPRPPVTPVTATVEAVNAPISTRPRSDPTDSLRRDPDHVAGRWVFEGRELHAGTDVHRGQSLEQLRGTTLDQTGVAVNDQVVGHPNRVGAFCLDGERHPRIASDVGHLAASREVTDHDLVAIEADPHHTDLRTAIGIDRDQVPEPARGEGSADVSGEDRHSVQCTNTLPALLTWVTPLGPEKRVWHPVRWSG